MLSHSIEVALLLQQNLIDSFLMVDMDVGRYYTTLPYDVEVDGNDYVSDGGLFAMERPKMTTSLDTASYNIKFLDSAMLWRELAETSLVGTKMSAWMGFINTLDTPVGGFEPSKPILDKAHMLMMHKGRISAAQYEINDSEVSFVMTVASPMGALDLTRAYFTTPESVRARYPMDTSFDQNALGSASLQLRWGKKR